jgi:hypothetical protein
MLIASCRAGWGRRGGWVPGDRVMNCLLMMPNGKYNRETMPRMEVWPGARETGGQEAGGQGDRRLVDRGTEGR